MYHASHEVARHSLAAAQNAWMRLQSLTGAYAAGTTGEYASLSRQAYLASNDLRTLAQTLDWARLGPRQTVLELAGSAQALFDRAMEHESAHRQGALSRAAAFFDDLLDPGDLDSDTLLARRPIDDESPQISNPQAI